MTEKQKQKIEDLKHDFQDYASARGCITEHETVFQADGAEDVAVRFDCHTADGIITKGISLFVDPDGTAEFNDGLGNYRTYRTMYLAFGRR